MTILGAQPTQILDLDVHDAQALVLEPAFNYDNIFQRTLGLYKFVIGVTKLKMLHLSRPGFNLQPKSGCDTWNPTVKLGLRPFEIGSKEYEVNGEQCPDEWDEGCLRNLKNSADELVRLDGRTNKTYNAMQAAIALQIRAGVSDDFYRIAEFGDEDFAAKVTAGFYDLSGYDPKMQAQIIAQQSHQNGWWSEIQARASEPTSNRFGRIRYVDTNDGTVNGNAMNPANIAAYLLQMRASADPLLGMWTYQMPGSNVATPIYELSGGLFDALLAYYRSLGTEMANALIINGLTVPNATTFDGWPVIRKNEWDYYQFEVGRFNAATGKAKTQYARLSVPQNLCGVAHMTTLEGQPSASLIIEKDPSVKAKGKSYIYGSYGIGFGIAQPVLMVAGYNSSDSYIYS